MTPYTPEDEIVARGQADWVHFPEMYWLVSKWSSAKALDPRQELIRVLRKLVSSELVRVGTVTQSEGFVPWGLMEDETVERVLREWDALDRRPTPGDVCWLANTPAGDVVAERLLSNPDPDKTWISDLKA